MYQAIGEQQIAIIDNSSNRCIVREHLVKSFILLNEEQYNKKYYVNLLREEIDGYSLYNLLQLSAKDCAGIVFDSILRHMCNAMKRSVGMRDINIDEFKGVSDWLATYKCIGIIGLHEHAHDHKFHREIKKCFPSLFPNDGYTYEVCPHCGKEVELSAELAVQKCPNCGKWIVPCSMCEAIDDSNLVREKYDYCHNCCLCYHAEQKNKREQQEQDIKNLADLKRKLEES